MLGKFKNLKLAMAYSEKTIKMSAIILGDDERFWIVTLAEMERLIKSGYETIN